MQLPSTADYSSLNALVEAVKTHAVAEEYRVVKKQSKADYKSGAVAKVNIICERGGESRRKFGARQRKTTSIKCGCPFRINAIYKQGLDI